eukprot:3857725-Lingulodinium_polyedra.AAC.1
MLSGRTTPFVRVAAALRAPSAPGWRERAPFLSTSGIVAPSSTRSSGNASPLIASCFMGSAPPS